MSATIIVTIFTVDPADVGRTPSGVPRVDSQTRRAQLYLATPSDDGAGWLLEAWHEDGGSEPRQEINLVADTDTLAGGIADAVRAIATRKD